MIINFSNLGGGGGGGYVLPVATDSRLGGIKVGSGLTITNEGVLSAEGGSDENAQHRLSASSIADMEALTGMSEGDVCAVLPSYTPSYDISHDVYYFMGWAGMNFFDTFNSFTGTWHHQYRIRIIDNPNAGQEAGEVPAGSSMIFHVEDEQYNIKYYGFRCNFEGEWEYLSNASSYDDEYWTPMVSGTPVVFDFTGTYNGYGGDGSNNSAYLFCEYPSSVPQNDQYKKAFTIDLFVEPGTYQYNDGEWVKLADMDAVSSAMTKAQEAFDVAQGRVATYGVNTDSWSNLEWYSPFIGEVIINNVNYGQRLHAQGAKTERANPKVDEIVTSASVGYIVPLTQDQYDALQTKDPNTLYAIIPDNS